MKRPEHLHVYRAIVTEVIDGDTIVVDLDLGFGLWRQDQKIRLLGCNCPEKKGETLAAGLKAQMYTAMWLGRSKYSARTPVSNIDVVVETFLTDTDSFGRVLARVWLADDEYADTMDLSSALIETGNAVPFMQDHL